MQKIPVFATIGGAYRFAFGRFLGNLGVVWVPVLLVMVASWYLLPRMMMAGPGQNMAITPGMTPAEMAGALSGVMQVYRVMILFWCADVLLRAQMMLGLTARALGTASGPRFIYLSLGRAYWRVAGAYFAVTVILIALYLVLIIAGLLGGILLALAVGAGGAAMGAAAGKAAIGATVVGLIAILGLVIGFVLFYAAVRLTFFLTVAIVDEGRFDLVEPWRLARRNFWRIVAVGLAIFVPISVVTFAIYLPLEFDAFRSFFTHMPMSAGHDPQAMGRAIQELSKSLRDAMFTHWYVVAPLTFISSALIYGLATGASVTAYRALVPGPAPAA